MPIARLAGNGMAYPDALELHALADAGVAWNHGAERLGDRNLARGHDALVRGHRHSARSWFFLASACFRFGQVVLPDADPRKRALYRRMLDAFEQAGGLHEPRFERIEVAWRHGTLSGWLMRARPSSPCPVVIQMCGIGGSREEYEVGCRYLLERGISAVLLDAPGQGETRLFGGLHLDEHVVDAITAILDVVVADPGCDGQVGLWGNSAGGCARRARGGGRSADPGLLRGRRNRPPDRDRGPLPALHRRGAADDRAVRPRRGARRPSPHGARRRAPAPGVLRAGRGARHARSGVPRRGGAPDP